MNIGPKSPPRMVIAAVIQRDGCFLMCKRQEHKRHGNLWEFPGGKLEPGESFMEAARRELFEELGVAVSDIGEIELAISDPGSDFLVNFVAVAIAGEPQALEHAQLLWLPLNELMDLPLAPTDKLFAAHLQRQSLDAAL